MNKKKNELQKAKRAYKTSLALGVIALAITAAIIALFIWAMRSLGAK